jgi:hypothetical protein
MFEKNNALWVLHGSLTLDTYPAWMLYCASLMFYSFFYEKKPVTLRSVARAKVTGWYDPGEIPKRPALLPYLPEKINHGDPKEVMSHRHLRDHGHLCRRLFPVQGRGTARHQDQGRGQRDRRL